MKNFCKKSNINNIFTKQNIILILLCLIGFSLFYGHFVHADAINFVSNNLGSAIALVLSWIAFVLNAMLGYLTTVLISIVVNIAQYNNIIKVPAVQIGWTTVRDICNMFFILILLVIAFGTILRIESYNAKKMLPKLLLMAILINFSKTIFGLVIDFAQVIMLTFTNGFSNGGGWFIKGFNVKATGEFQTWAESKNTGYTGWATAMAVIAGVFASITTLIVVAVMVAVLAMRIVMLWIYTILSPLFFFGMALPALQKYTNKIWEDFIKAVIIGPMLAFFIWLALTTAMDSSKALSDPKNLVAGNQICVGESAFFCNAELQNYIIFIGLMLGGLMVTQQIGGAAGSIAGKGMAKVTAAGGLGYMIGKKSVRGAVVGAGSFGTNYLSQGDDQTRRGRFREWVGGIGARGGLTQTLGISKLATSSLAGMKSRNRTLQEKGQKFLSNIEDERIIRKYANSRALTPISQVLRKTARNMAPSKRGAELGANGQWNYNPEQILNQLRTMKEEDVRKIPKKELAAIGQAFASWRDPQTGAPLNINIQRELAGTEFEDYVSRSRSAKRAYNEGVHEVGGMNNFWIQGRNRNTGMLTQDVGFDPDAAHGYDNHYEDIGHITFQPFNETQSRYIRSFRDPLRARPRVTNPAGTIDLNHSRNIDSRYEYRLADNEEKVGNGNLSVNDFGKGKANTLAVDFSQLNLDSMKIEGKGFDGIKGVNTKDRREIAAISGKMLGLIDKEMSDLENKIGAGVEKKKDYLLKARERFSNPDSIDNLSLVNSGAKGYTAKEVAKTRLHEELHGYGISDEDDAERLATHAIQTGQRVKTKEWAGEVKSGRKSVDEIISLERKSSAEDDDSEKQPETNYKTEESIYDQNNSTQSAKAKTTNPEIKQAIDSIKQASFNTPKSFFDIAYALKTLTKAVQGQTSELGRKGKGISDFSSLKPEEMTPLEINIITDKIKKTLDDENLNI